MKIAIVATHPVQYYAPVFRRLAQDPSLHVRVFYGWEGLTNSTNIDPGFRKSFTWDIPLLEGYDHEFLTNISTEPGTHHFGGIDCPSLPFSIQSWKADVILLYGWSFKSHLHVIRLLGKKIPIVFRGDSTLLDESPGIQKWARRLYLRGIYRNVRAATYVGTKNKDYFRAVGFDDSNLFFAPHAVDNDRFCNAPDTHRDAEMLRQSLGIHAEHRVILFVGKIEKKKAPDLLLNVFRNLNIHDLHLVFVGTGPLLDLLKASRPNNVHFLDFQNQSKMPAIYRLGDVIILPSRGPGETWGLVLNEAMACGRPVIASTKVGACADLVIENETGWRFRSDNADELCTRIKRVASVPRNMLLSQYGVAAHKLVQQGWTIELQIKGIRQALITVVEGRHRGP